jgi:uncharacterized protein (DUF4415 family)
MSSSSRNLPARLKEMDFSNAKPVRDVPALARLQASEKKERITIRLDTPILEEFRALAQKQGTSYQTLINEALKEKLRSDDLLQTVRKTIRAELRAAKS